MVERLSAEDRQAITRQVIDSVDFSNDAEQRYLGLTLTNFYLTLEAILDDVAAERGRRRVARAQSRPRQTRRCRCGGGTRTNRDRHRIGMEDAARIARSKP